MVFELAFYMGLIVGVFFLGIYTVGWFAATLYYLISDMFSKTTNTLKKESKGELTPLEQKWVDYTVAPLATIIFSILVMFSFSYYFEGIFMFDEKFLLVYVPLASIALLIHARYVYHKRSEKAFYAGLGDE